VDTLLVIGLNNALLATLLAVVAAAVSRCCRRPALVHGLWLLVLLKLLTPPVVTVPLPWPGVPGPVAPAQEPAPVTLGVPETADAPTLPPAQPEVAETPARPPTTAALRWQSVLAGVWLAGSALWLVLVGGRVVRFQRLLRRAQPAPAPLQEGARQLAARLGLARCPGVWLVPAPVSPLLWALLRTPRLLLPAGLWERLNEEQQATLLLHELAHLRRGDPWVRRLELVVLALYWWHPVAWWAQRRLREAEEQCCDAWVVWALPSAARSYATALVETVAFLSGCRSLPAGASGAGQVPVLKRRLTMILRGKTPRRLTWPGLLALLGVGVLLLPLAPVLNQRLHADPLRPPAVDQPAESAPATTPNHQPPATTSQPAPAKTVASDDLVEQIEKARDEVELFEADMQAAKADRQLAVATLEAAKVNLNRAQQLSERGAVTEKLLLDARQEVVRTEAGVQIADAKLTRAEINLKQAVRRLKRLEERAKDQPAQPGTDRKKEERGKTMDDDRLRELDRKLDAILKAIESLKQERKPREPQEPVRLDQPAKTSGANSSGVLYVNDRKFAIPFEVDPQQSPRIRELELYVSMDEGKTWIQAATSKPDKGRFEFEAPRDGRYWFNLVIIDVEGKNNHHLLTEQPPALKVQVTAER
jgi:bla regulator protein blaR1